MLLPTGYAHRDTIRLRNNHWHGDKCQWNSGRANEKLVYLFAKFIDFSGKLPSGPGGGDPKFAACDTGLTFFVSIFILAK